MEPVALTPTQEAPTVAPDTSDILTEASKPEGHRYLMKHYGADIGDKRANEACAKIWEWAKQQSESTDRDEILLTALRMQRKLGVPSGMRPWAMLEIYVKTFNNSRKLEQQLKEMEKV